MATLFKTTGEVTDVTPKNGKYFELKELQDYVGGYIEGIRLPGNNMMYVNEEGLLLNLQHNLPASMYVSQHNKMQYNIFGDAIVVPFNEESDAYDNEDDD